MDVSIRVYKLICHKYVRKNGHWCYSDILFYQCTISRLESKANVRLTLTNTSDFEEDQHYSVSLNLSLDMKSLHAEPLLNK